MWSWPTSSAKLLGRCVLARAVRYTSSERLVANGGSASGILPGAAIVQRPDLFGAAVINFPALDQIRYLAEAGGEGEGAQSVAFEDRERAAAEVRGGEVEVAVQVPVAHGEPARAPRLAQRYGRVKRAIAATPHVVDGRVVVPHRQSVLLP